jgi:hypothetical protein
MEYINLAFGDPSVFNQGTPSDIGPVLRREWSECDTIGKKIGYIMVESLAYTGSSVKKIYAKVTQISYDSKVSTSSNNKYLYFSIEEWVFCVKAKKNLEIDESELVEIDILKAPEVVEMSK